MLRTKFKKVYLLVAILYFLQPLVIKAAMLECSGDSWVIEHKIDNKKSTLHFDCAKTDNYVFFGYGVAGIIDVYNYEGEYLFTLRYTRSTSNRYMDIRCAENLLYVASHAGEVYVFDGSVLIETLTYDEAEESGYDISWFSKQTMWANREYVYCMNEEGNWVEFMRTPKEIAENMPLINISPDNKGIAVFLLIVVGGVLFSLLGIFILKQSVLKNSKT